MGYEVHITRRDFWADEDADSAISLEEWKVFLKSQPDMRLDNYAEFTLEGETFRHENEGIAVWTAYSGGGKDGNHAWFTYGHGVITVKNPDEEILAQMSKIARLMKAVVQGSDGELYEDGKLKHLPETGSPGAVKKPWWKFW